MRKVTFWLLWIVVFAIPWEESVVLFNIGTLPKLFGMLAVSAGFLTVISSGRIRRPGPILGLGLAFTAITVVSLLWTISSDASTGRVLTYAQLLGLAWLVWEFAQTLEEQELLMLAYCLGACVSIADLIRSFVAGEEYVTARFTGGSLDPNDLGVTLAIAIPMAWQLFLTRTGILRFCSAAYVPLALVAILLTASRGAFPAALAAVSIIPLTVRWRSSRSIFFTMSVLVGVVALTATIVPAYSWQRILTLPQEALEGTISGRLQIWTAALEAFRQKPVIGFGAGAFEFVIEPFIGRQAPHNVFIAVLVEQGVVGVSVLVTLLAACAWHIYSVPKRARGIFAIVGLTWLVGSMSLSWQYRKPTWLIIGLIAAQGTVATAPRNFLHSTPTESDVSPFGKRRVALEHHARRKVGT